jgi:D-alanyl-D-alanine carboxypeptidase
MPENAIRHQACLSTHRPLTRRTMLGITGAALAGAALGNGANHIAAAQDASPVDAAAFPLDEQAALEAIVATSLADTGTPGALAGIWYPGRGDWVHAAGFRDLKMQSPAAIDDHVRIASITKTFVATVILQLVDEGALGLDDSLESHLAGVPNGDGITIRQVLGMSAGIFDFIHDPVIAEDYVADPLLPFTPDDALAIIRASTPDFAPGERVQYSNSNYVLLGFILEQLTGQPAETAIAERILEPLGMTNTSFPVTAEMPEPYLPGYADAADGGPLRDVTLSNPAIPWTSGAMISTLADLRIWARALAIGTLLTPESQAARLQWGTIATGPLQVAYGLGILQINGLVGHNGGIFGYSSWMMHATDEDATIVVVTNRSGTEGGTADPIVIQLVSRLFPDRFAGTLPGA